MEPVAARFTMGTSRIGLSPARTSIGSPYGAAGSLVVLTLWVFYASMIVFFGAELTSHPLQPHPTRAGFNTVPTSY